MDDLNALSLPARQRMSKDLKMSSVTMSRQEARDLVDTYYRMQNNRIRAEGQIRAIDQVADATGAETDPDEVGAGVEFDEDGEPIDAPVAPRRSHAILDWLADQDRGLENQVKQALDYYSDANPLGKWARAQKGIGPVIAAGLLAHINMEKAFTAGAIWRYAGLDPSVKWEKGQIRPWNSALKVLCWKAGESFVKVSGKEDAFYGQLYKERKVYEIERNERGGNAATAAQILIDKNFKGDTVAKKKLTAGFLPDAQIHARARRYAVKIFLSHFHLMGYRLLLNKEPPAPFAIAILGHTHMIDPPH